MGFRDLNQQRRSKSLDELESTDLGPPDFNSHLVQTCHRLRKVPIGQFSVEDLRIMIGQNIGSQFLVPIALEVVDSNPYAEGDFYPGDLLVALVRLPVDFWRRHSDFRVAMEKVIAKGIDWPVEVSRSLDEFRKSLAD